MTVHERLETVFREVLNQPGLELRDEMGGPDIAGWDSLAHINVMFGIEEEFGVQFVGTSLRVSSRSAC